MYVNPFFAGIFVGVFSCAIALLIVAYIVGRRK